MHQTFNGGGSKGSAISSPCDPRPSFPPDILPGSLSPFRAVFPLLHAERHADNLTWGRPMLDMALSAAWESGFQTGETSSHIHLWVYDGFMVAIRGTLNEVDGWCCLCINSIRTQCHHPFPISAIPRSRARVGSEQNTMLASTQTRPSFVWGSWNSAPLLVNRTYRSANEHQTDIPVFHPVRVTDDRVVRDILPVSWSPNLCSLWFVFSMAQNPTLYGDRKTITGRSALYISDRGGPAAVGFSAAGFSIHATFLQLRQLKVNELRTEAIIVGTPNTQYPRLHTDPCSAP